MTILCLISSTYLAAGRKRHQQAKGSVIFINYSSIMQKAFLLILALISATIILAQPEVKHIDKLIVPVANNQKKALAYATVELLRGKDSGFHRPHLETSQATICGINSP